MAPAGCEPTSTWTQVRDLEPLLLEICGSPSYCAPWLAKQIAAGLVRWRARATDPPDEPLDKFWQRSTPVIDLKDCKATGLVVAPPGTMVGLCPVTLFGLEVVREDVEALRPLSGGEVSNPKPPKKPTGERRVSVAKHLRKSAGILDRTCQAIEGLWPQRDWPSLKIMLVDVNAQLKAHGQVGVSFSTIKRARAHLRKTGAGSD
jgi:hypothetical protein